MMHYDAFGSRLLTITTHPIGAHSFGIVIASRNDQLTYRKSLVVVHMETTNESNKSGETMQTIRDNSWLAGSS